MIKALLLGCGERGLNVYGAYAKLHPTRLKFIACADINKKKREIFAKFHQIDNSLVFDSDEQALEKGKLADVVFICTPDDYHYNSVKKAIELGYHIFLEKPMAISENECRQLVSASEEAGIILMVGHVLRYSPLFSKVKELVQDGLIGNVVNIKHSENMGIWVYAHSFVRGIWGNSQKSTPLILQKGVHDLDLIYWFVDSQPMELASIQTPTPFTDENAPIGAPKRCTDGCPYSNSCLYETTQTYLQGRFILQDLSRANNFFYRLLLKFAIKYPTIAPKIFPILRKYQIAPWRRWPTSHLSEDLSEKALLETLKTGPYGRCIYHCDNDQPVSQIVSVKFKNGITASYTLHGMSYRDGREIRIDGTKGTLQAFFHNTEFRVELFDHSTGSTKIWNLPPERSAGGGGDYKIAENFVNAVDGLDYSPCTPRDALESHLMAFAAIKSNKSGSIEKIVH